MEAYAISYLFRTVIEKQVRAATAEEIEASNGNTVNGIFTSEGEQYYVDAYDPSEVDDDDWRREIAREEGMLNGIDSYNDWMGY